MSASVILVLLVLIVGERAGDVLERRQQEVVLGKLPISEAHAYYHRLRQRSRRIRLLRALTVTSLLAMVYVYRHTMTGRANTAPPPPAGSTATR